MKNRLPHIILFLVGQVVCSGFLKAESAKTVESTAKATILEILQLVKVQDMSFGRMANGETGVVELKPSGERLVSGVTAVGESGWRPARFEVRGTLNYEYYIGLPSDITLEKDGKQLVIEDLVARPSSSGENALKGIISADAYFTVGGKLIIASPDLPPGEYRANFEVSVGYN
jgi:hypothetical protein